MEKDKIFFGTEGLTTTSANHIANLAKEAYQSLESKLNSAVFYTTEIGILGSSASNTLKEGIEQEFLDELEGNLMQIASYKSLIAWLREAIKAKERLISEAQKLTDVEVAKILNITLPDMPVRYPRLNEDEVVATWGIKQRNRYYYLDTVCSTIGKYIHPNTGFSNAKEDLIKILSERHKAQGNGRDTIIYSYTPTVRLKDVEHTFFALQEKYRGYQAELNSMKHQIEVAIQDDEREKTLKEEDETKQYKVECNAIFPQLSKYKNDTIKAMQSLKIVIPDSLKGIYSTISEMGKEE